MGIMCQSNILSALRQSQLEQISTTHRAKAGNTPWPWCQFEGFFGWKCTLSHLRSSVGEHAYPAFVNTFHTGPKQ